MVFFQSEWLRGRRRFALEDDHDTLHVEARDGRTARSFNVPLGVLREEPGHLRASSIVPIIFFAGFGALALLCMSGVIIGPALEARLTAGFAVCIFGSAACAGFARWRQVSFDVVVFYNRFNGTPVFNLFRNRPDPDSFDRFVAALVKRIQAAQAGTVAAEKTSIPAQIEAYARLAERGLISPPEFEGIKQKLLESAVIPAKQIGFVA